MHVVTDHGTQLRCQTLNQTNAHNMRYRPSGLATNLIIDSSDAIGADPAHRNLRILCMARSYVVCMPMHSLCVAIHAFDTAFTRSPRCCFYITVILYTHTHTREEDVWMHHCRTHLIPGEAILKATELMQRKKGCKTTTVQLSRSIPRQLGPLGDSKNYRL